MVKIFSIKNEYSTKIFQNEKHVELRRQNIKIEEDEKCLIYTTSPIRKVTGYFIVKKTIRLPIKQLWKRTKNIAGISKSQFIDYFKGCIEGTAIFFKTVKRFIKQISLDEMKAIKEDFRPPQSYSNLDEFIYQKILTISKESVIHPSGF